MTWADRIGLMACLLAIFLTVLESGRETHEIFRIMKALPSCAAGKSP